MPDEEVKEEEEVVEEAVGDTDEKTDEEVAEEEAMTDDERAELEKLRKKEMNFKKLRNQTSKEKKEIAKEKEDLEKEKEDYKVSLIKERKEDALSLLVGDDEDKRKKALLNFDRIVGETKTKEEVFNKMREAVNMMGGSQEASALNRSYRGGNDRFGSSGKQESEASREMREMSGITDEDKKKYGSKEWKPKI